jgi:hypothetical protein
MPNVAATMLRSVCSGILLGSIIKRLETSKASSQVLEMQKFPVTVILQAPEA